ncbi:MAG TPA: cation-translocating P-type ATPase [Blastocatellia bacterium]|nr:cation-translocating P-type ATPase [Blastocatellia bacterium]
MAEVKRKLQQRELKEMPSPVWHSLPVEKVLERLNVTADGLSTEEAKQRVQQYGPNALREAEPIHPLAILLGQFNSLVIWLLVGAGVVSGLLGEWIDSIAILTIVVLNAVIGFFQEYKAGRAIEALKKMTSPRARVRRAGSVVMLPSVEIVPGDIIELEAGDLVPADARLLDAASLKCVEAALTGESDAVNKHAAALEQAEVPLGNRRNMVFMGTSVAAGTGHAVVTATGMETEFGHIAGLLAEASFDESTPLQQRLAAVGRMLVWVSLGVVGVIFILGFLRSIPPVELFLTSVSLAVAAVPEGLPAVVTVALALGVQRMARRRALVRKLPAVETLGSTSVICTDKTGTLTVGEMTVRTLYAAEQSFTVAGEGYGPNGEILINGAPPDDRQSEQLRSLLTLLTGCNGAHLSSEDGKWAVIGDPTEGALLTAGMKFGLEQSAIETQFPRVGEYPFDSDRKRMTVIRRLSDGRLRAMVKGAPDILLGRCTHILGAEGVRQISGHDVQLVTARIADMAQGALRVLAAAYREVDEEEIRDAEADGIERRLVFVGLAGMYDPPRPEAREAVSRCHGAGIRVVMITGDHQQTAMAVARELGIARSDEGVLTGLELDHLSDDELKQRVTGVAVYARVSAEHKLRIVRAWKAAGAVIAMTGDGVNDAPAIKGADIGIAMGKSGTEVTKEASDMVITDDNFASIAAAVEEGRGVYDNIRKTLQYLLAGNLGELLMMTVSVLVGWPIPLLPVHLLWINLVTDGLPALALATDPIDPDVMNRPPRPRSESITDRKFFTTMILTGLLTAGVSLAAYLYGLRYHDLDTARTFAFATLVYAEILRSFGARSETRAVWEIGLLSNIRLALIAALTLVFQPWAHHNQMLRTFLKSTEMSWSECLALLAVGAIPLAALEAVKVLRRHGGAIQPETAF